MEKFSQPADENGHVLLPGQTVSDRPKIMGKFSQPADENGHVLLPGFQGTKLPISSAV